MENILINKRSLSFSDQISLFYPYQYNNIENAIQTPSITFQVTDQCNLQCTYCYQINKSNHIMPFEVAQKFIDLLLENNINTQQYINTKLCNGVILDFIGGETFLQPQLIDQIIEYFIKRCIEEDHPWQYNWRISISSNGTLYFKPEVQEFINKWKNKLSFNISIDGNKQLHDTCRIYPDGRGSYDEAIKAVRHYVDVLHGKMGSKVTLAPNNIQYTFEAIKNLIKQNYTEIYVNCIFEKGWTNEHAIILYNQLKQLANYVINNNLENQLYISIFEQNFFQPIELTNKDNWCGGNGKMIAVDWKGDIYPCLRYAESSLGNNKKPIIIGNVYSGIMCTEEQKKIVKNLKSINRLNQSTKECIECPIALGCAWCQAYNYQDSGSFFHRATYICCMHKARSLANAYYWNKIFQKYNSNKRFKIWLSDKEILNYISNEELILLKKLEGG